MIIQILASGSKGNVTYIEEQGYSVLVDCGLSARETVRRLRSAGKEPEKIRGIFITHDHQDHIRGARVFSKSFNIPVILSEELYTGMDPKWLRDINNIQLYKTGSDIPLETLLLRPFPVSHDATQTVNLTFTNGKKTAGLFTDLGTVSVLVKTHALTADLIIAEANHDISMLSRGPYPLWLQQRIRSKIGHLSNKQCADFLTETCLSGKIQNIVLGHISEENNRYDLALQTIRQHLQNHNIDIPVQAATQFDGCKEIIL
jgi:phosphoribosyl 1,2-cyclic phosphodiesterase